MVELLASLEPEEGRSLLAQYMEVCHDLKADLKVEALLGIRAADPDSFRHIFAELICASAWKSSLVSGASLVKALYLVQFLMEV